MTSWPSGGKVAPALPGHAAKGFRSVSEYGPRTPIDTNGDGRPDTDAFHTGIDLVGMDGYNRACETGVVSFAGYNGSAGNEVRVDHNGWRERHYHGKLPLVRAGQTVTETTALAPTGMTGAALGVHDHLRIEVGGVMVDPRPFLEQRIRGGGSGGSSGGDTATLNQGDEPMTDLIYYVTAASTDKRIAAEAMFYQESPGAPIFPLTDYKAFGASAAGFEYQAFVAARHAGEGDYPSAYAAGRFPITGDNMLKLLALRGVTAKPIGNFTPAVEVGDITVPVDPQAHADLVAIADRVDALGAKIDALPREIDLYADGKKQS